MQKEGDEEDEHPAVSKKSPGTYRNWETGVSTTRRPKWATDLEILHASRGCNRLHDRSHETDDAKKRWKDELLPNAILLPRAVLLRRTIPLR